MVFCSKLPVQHPIIDWRLRESREKKHFSLIVVDPRVTMFVRFADMCLVVAPHYD